MSIARAAALALLVAACGSESAPVAPPPSLDLLPAVFVDGGWHGAESDGACESSDGTTTCPAGSAGSVTLVRDGDELHVSFAASADATVEALAAQGTGTLAGATRWISNGFQSWSQTGAVSLRPSIDDADLQTALAARGDGETVRDGYELSWGFSVVGGGASYLLVGATTAKRFKPWVQVTSAVPGKLAVRLVSGGAGEQVAVAAGDRLDGEAFHVRSGTDLAALAKSYAAALPSRRNATPVPAEAGWNSWYELWDQPSEQDIRDNAAKVLQLLEPRVPAGTSLRIVVDDGWEQGWGDWQPNARFPSGLDGLANDLSAQGFKMGVWLAPLLVAASSPLATAHPDWFIQGASYKHLKNGEMLILDVTNPAAADHLRQTIQQIVGWGYSLLKIDFLFAGTYEGTRSQPVTGMQAYNQALSIIRDAAGEDTLLLGVGAPGIASLPYVDAWRVGGDIALENFGPSWPYVTSEARTVGARAPLCYATLCDADPVLFRTLTQEEVGSGGWVVAFGGGALFLSDNLPALDATRVDWGLDAARVGYALGGEPALPVDYLPEGAPDHLVSALADQLKPDHPSTAVVPRIWRMPDGKRVGFNATDEAVTIDGTDVPARAARPLK